MKRRIMRTAIAILLLFAGSCIFLYNKKPTIDSVAKKLLRSNPTAIIRTIEPVEEDITKPNRIMWVIIGEEKIYLYEYKDKNSAEFAMAVMSDGGVGVSYTIAKSKGKLLVCYKGQSQEIISQFDDLLD